MSKKIPDTRLLFIIALLSLNNIYGQGERDFWYFGQLAGMKFTDGIYESISDNSIPRNVFLGIIEGPDNIICASDDEGNLLFYSDGRTFKNKFHENLLNSPTEEYAFRESQAAVTRDPGNPNKYYVFITIMDGLVNRLTYTVVDMSLNNGRGGLVPDKKHIVMVNDTGQHMVVAQHANGIDSWLICIRRGSYYAYLITENGISTSPVTSQAGFSFFNGNALKFGNMIVSPDNSLIGTGFPLFSEESGGFTSKVLLSRFNNLNGKLSLIYEVSESVEPMAGIPSSGIEFSSNSKVLYSAYIGNSIKQYDLSNLDIIPPATTIVAEGPYQHFKRGPNGQIFSITRGDNYIGAIKYPNVLGLGCDFRVNVLNLTGSNLLDLPTFLLPKYPEGISYKNICEGETMEFFYTSPIRNPSYRWDLGDGTMANGENVFHTYDAPGTYTVIVEAIDNNTNTVMYTDTKEVTIYASPAINQPEDIYICSEDTIIYFSNYDADILNNLNPATFKASYYFTENDAQTLSNAETQITPEIGTQTIWVRVQNIVNPLCYDVKHFDLLTPEYIDLNIPEIQYICNDRTGLLLEAPDGFLSYLWSNGEMSQNIQVFTPGIYTLTVIKDFGNFTCEAQTRISVRVGDELPEIVEINVIDWSQNHNSIEVILDRSGNYEFSIDGINFQESPIIQNLPFKEDYIVYVRDVDCQKTIQSDTLFLLYYDKFFTPNGDGRHDYWRVINNFREDNIEIQIFDRYGKLLETMSYYDRGWDGTSNGVEMPTSDYWFRVVRQNGNVHHGHFTLKR